MSDPASTARTARESLSKGLNALQSDPNLPPALMELAAPIAQAMGALHQIERSNGAQLQPHANVALENVRAALAALQTGPQHVPAIGTAMESVASSLSQVHALSKLAGPPAQQAAPAPAAAPQKTAPVQQVPQPMAQQQQFQPQPVAQQAPVYAPQQLAPQPMPQQPAFPPPQQNVQPQVAADPFAAPRAPQQSPMAATAYAAPQAAPAPQPYVQPQAHAPIAAPPPAGDLPIISADLGAQSATNFYKGLSGNDIIDHGGLFISTYKIPKIGTPVRLKVSLPGGYEFEANAVVRWSRDPSDASDSAPPGFGAQLTHITPEARQLVYRYVRNREPLFHDDL